MGHAGKHKTQTPPPIYIISGGAGASGEQVVETVLAQFRDVQIPIHKIAHTRHRKQVRDVVLKASRANATIVHTLVDADLRQYLIQLAGGEEVVTVDLMGPLLDRLTEVLGRKPEGQPGLYRHLRRNYFDRIAAIEFTLAHDDGKNPQDLPRADIVLTGVSRSGKTPLSMYLGVLGWKVANVPLILDSPLPSELSQIDRGRVFGLDIDLDRVLHHRRQRQARRGSIGPSAYTDPKLVCDEVEAARALCHKHRFSMISVTDKPIETSADEIIEAVTRRFGDWSGD
jgi:regulator of PEP synthase PpsR (kinase-PPPase family)